MKILVQIEIKIRIKSSLSGKFAFTVFIVPTFIPHGITTVEIRTHVVGDIGNNKLCFRDAVPLIILEIVIEQFCFDVFQIHNLTAFSD